MEIVFPLSDEGKEIRTPLYPLERANFNDWADECDSC
jgi:hypothetical protein